MSPFDVLRFAVGGLLANRMRSLLTMLGIIIGVAAVITLTAVGNGASTYIQNQIAGLGAGSITVSAQTPSAASGSTGRPLTTADASALADPQGAPDIASVSPVIQTSVDATVGRATASLTAVGSEASYFGATSTEVAVGRAYRQADLERAAKVVVLGRTAADDLFGAGSNPVGRSVDLSGTPYEVIGTLAEQGQGGGPNNTDSNALVPLSALQNTLVGYDAELSQIVVSSRDTASGTAAEAQITSILDRRHHVSNDDDRDFQIVSSQQLTSVLDSTLTALTLLLGAIAGISLLVGGIGITNIMLVTVSERTREIGIRKALGAPASVILGQFLTEATILSLLGGLIGVGLGLLSMLIDIAGFRPEVLPVAVVGALLVTVAIGIFFGTYPALRAARLRPIEALRRE